MLGIPAYLWRLAPANPILLRVVATAGKRNRDLITRCIYLGLLVGFVVISIANSGDISGASLDDLTRTSERIFMQMSFLQLFLVALLAPIFTAGAITQEKDSQTYDILLSTPLTNGQIVLGSLLSRLFFIIALLVSGIPIFSITKIFGGVAIGDIVISFAIAAATACVTGALATAIATFKVGTRRTIFSFYMMVVIYLVGGYLLQQLDFFKVRLIDPATGQAGELSQTGWLTGIHPFLALQTLFPGGRPPDATLLPAHLRVWPLEWYFTRPATFFPSFMMALSLVLVLPAIALLRKMAQSTSTIQTTLLRLIPIRAIRAARKPRTVWNNPIAWREARTKASAARASVLRYGFILIGLAGAITLLVLYQSEDRAPQNFIQAGSYSPAEDTLHILGVNQTFGIDPGTAITLDGKEATADRLSGRFEVAAYRPVTRRGVKVLTTLDLRSIAGKISRQQAHEFLLGAIIVEVAVILLIVTNAAASTVTREREDGTLDLLLTTPITSRYYLWGKLAGLVSFMLPLLAVPALSAGIFVIADLCAWIVAGNPHVQWLVLPESVLAMPAVLVIIVAFATVIGMQMSMRNRTTVRAVMSSLGIVIGVMSLLGWCGMTSMSARGGLGGIAHVIGGFSPLSVITTMVYPEQFGGEVWQSGDETDIFAARMTLLVFTIISAAVYSFIIFTMYKSMVKNFDMSIRRQSR
ncbi:MAG: ABC transporter permease subunit [Burkholderiales bacterium]|nr:ABC transporter permease subunit [Phycisphaerae bacterium]